ncbi:hypothetical protein [Mycobacterium sp. UM_WWY]
MKPRDFVAAVAVAGALGSGAVVVGAPMAHADHPLWDCGGYPADICANFPWNAHAGDVGWGGDGPPPAEFNEGRFAGCDWNWWCIRDRIRDDN